MLNMEEIISKLKAQLCLINVTIEEEDIPLDQGLMGEEIIDSYGFVEFVAFIEEEFDIEFEDDEINEDNFANLIMITQYIQGKLKQKIDSV
jgi:acyl carrier protein